LLWTGRLSVLRRTLMAKLSNGLRPIKLNKKFNRHKSRLPSSLRNWIRPTISKDGPRRTTLTNKSEILFKTSKQKSRSHQPSDLKTPEKV
jgi:hypothetical protein